MVKAALLDIGCNPFISFIVTLLIVGFIVWIATWLLGLATFIAEPFRGIARQVIYIVAVAYIVLLALQIIFGIRIITGVSAIGCG